MDDDAGASTAGDDLVAALTRWLAEQRADEAAASRAREAGLRRAAAEDATFAGVLRDLAERTAVVVLTGVGGRVHRGTVRVVGRDVVVVRTALGDVLVRADAVAAIRGEGTPPAGADRPPALDVGLAEALAAVADDRPRVVAVARDGRTVVGELRSVGVDVATVRLDDGAATVVVPLAAVAEVRVVP